MFPRVAAREISCEFWLLLGYPPSPHTCEKLAGSGVCKKCLQNPDCRWFKGQNLERKRVTCRLALFSYTASALTMMRSLRVGRKVGYHKVVVEMLRIVSAGLSLVNERDRNLSPTAVSEAEFPVNLRCLFRGCRAESWSKRPCQCPDTSAMFVKPSY